jgi:UDP-glucose 4-epimerase
MRVLITGGAGFIGSHLSDFYYSRGDVVTIVDNFSTGSSTNIDHLKDKVSVVSGDIRDASLIQNLVSDSDLVLHMAAALGVKTILESPIESISTNVIGSEVVLNAATKFKTRIIIASTSEIYGKNPKQPLSETDDRVVGAPQKIRWSYSDAKAIEEAMAFALNKEKQLPVTTIRLFNTVGPRQTGEYGMVIPRFVENALKGKPLTVYGDGLQSRSFCHVHDVVRAITTVAENKDTIANVFNIGNTLPITISDLATKIIAVLESKSKVEFMSYENAYQTGFEDLQSRIPNIEKISNFTGWTPRLTLEDIIHDVANYIRSN